MRGVQLHLKTTIWGRGESRGGGNQWWEVCHPLWPSLLLSRERERRTLTSDLPQRYKHLTIAHLFKSQFVEASNSSLSKHHLQFPESLQPPCQHFRGTAANEHPDLPDARLFVAGAAVPEAFFRHGQLVFPRLFCSFNKAEGSFPT